MKKLFFVLLFLWAAVAHAQDETVKKLSDESRREVKKDPADTIPRLWRRGGIISANLNQGSLKNWAAGGDDYAFSINSLVSLFAFYKNGKNSWDNSFDFNYGFIKTTSLGSRKNDDRLDLLSKYGYALGPKWNLAALANFRTQLFKGYTYDEGVRTFVSDFLSPANLLIGIGFDYKPNPEFSLYLSPLTARWIIVRNETLRPLYGIEPGKQTRSELGAFVSANYIKSFNPVLSYKGRLDLFSNYRNNPQNIDLFMTNIFSARLSRALSATWNLDLIYDDDIRLFGENKRSPALQIKSLIGAGLLMKFGAAR